ncbi:MAG: serine hydrolase domain-containing protein [Myxococcaceae bacterium]|nr:serine hydrolase domain-containing protein [Myxococcaceae bacterium]
MESLPPLPEPLDAGAPLDDGGAPVDAGANGDGGPSRWQAVTDSLAQAVSAGEVPGYQFVVRTEADQPVYASAGGAFSAQTVIPFDSSIKPITSALVLTLVRDGQLALTDTLGARLGWTGPEAAVTIEQLLAFSSGFPGSSPCLTPPPQLRNGQLVEPANRAPLEQCANTIRSAGLVAPPGTEFHYGANHQLLLAVVAERVTGKSWNALFDERLAMPVGLEPGSVRYVNNRVAASAVGTADAFARLYRALALDGGFLRGQSATILLPRPLMDRFTENVTRDRSIRLADTPWEPTGREVHFGLGVWIECTDWARRDTCVFFGSGGNGTTVWIDPSSGHVGALVLYQGSFTRYRTGYTLMTRLLPLVRAAIQR